MAYEHATTRYRIWYAKLLRFYPKPYRERFGEGMEQTFNDLYRERQDAGEGVFGFALWTFADTLAGIINENMKMKYMIPIYKKYAVEIIIGLAGVIWVFAWAINGPINGRETGQEHIGLLMFGILFFLIAAWRALKIKTKYAKAIGLASAASIFYLDYLINGAEHDGSRGLAIVFVIIALIAAWNAFRTKDKKDE